MVVAIMQHHLPQLMGILNITHNSFFDGGKFTTIDAAIDRAAQMIKEGAQWLDVGGESSHPGAQAISEQQELDRVLPVITALKQRFETSISIDTCKARIMEEAISAGATMINDIWALRQPGTLKVAAATTTMPICLMHMQGEPTTMQRNPTYENDDVVQAVNNFFVERIKACEEAGIARNRIILDPGIGFGKTLPQNLQLLNRLNEFHKFNLPILIGVSRKTMIGQLLDKPAEERLFGSIGATIVAVRHRIQIIRTHDVGPTYDALRVALAIEKETA